MKKILTNTDIANKVDSEGLDYAITDYFGCVPGTNFDFEDEYLANLWNQAYELLTEIQEILDNARGDFD